MFTLTVEVNSAKQILWYHQIYMHVEQCFFSIIFASVNSSQMPMQSIAFKYCFEEQQATALLPSLSSPNLPTSSSPFLQLPTLLPNSYTPISPPTSPRTYPPISDLQPTIPPTSNHPPPPFIQLSNPPSPQGMR